MTDSSPRFTRLDPDTTDRLRRNREKPRASRKARAVEIALFGTFALLVALAGLAVWALYSPAYREVPNRIAEGIERDRVNVLLIGIGGPTHIGGGKDLADALLLASFKPSTGEVAMISVPRDLYVPIESYGTHRINEAHRIGNQTAYPGRGPKLTMDTVSRVFGVPIHAFARIDFAAFEKVIDQIGGVDVYVERSFHDYLFDDGFQKGWQHLDGERALRYARYRYSHNWQEGTTFARERRQRQVIEAVRAKLQNGDGMALNLIRAAKTLSDHSATNLTTAQMIWFWRHFGGTDPEKIQQVSLEPYVEVFELQTLADSGEAVRPTRGDFTDLRRIARGLFEAPPPRQEIRSAAVLAPQPS
ncbi:MAG: LCP family protein [Thermoanaerobaculia bacterium]